MRPWQRLTLFALATIVPIYIFVYFQGYVRPSHHPESAGVYESMRIALQAQAVALGPSATGLWPAIGVAVLLVGLWVIALLVWKSFRDRLDPTTVGMLLFVLAGGAVAFGIGWGRSGFHDDMGLAWRYGWITFPPIAAAYMTWLRCGRWIGKIAPALLCIIVVIITPVNSISGFMHAEKMRAHQITWEADVRSGMTADQVIAKHYPDYPQSFRDEMAATLRLMRDRRYSYYESLGRESP
jgi:hypothetical protein